MKKIFNPVLGRGEGDDLKIDRVHRVKKPLGLKEDVPRDVIVKFHQYEDKAKIWSRLRGVHTLRGSGPPCFHRLVGRNLGSETTIKIFIGTIKRD